MLKESIDAGHRIDNSRRNTGVTAQIPKAKTRNNLLDLSRYLAAMCVLLYHLAYRSHAEAGIGGKEYEFFDAWVRYGYLGVPFFFMISGYVILLSANRQPQWQGFLASRAARLYPAYWVAVFATVAVMVLAAGNPTNITLSQVIVNLSMLQTFVGVDHIDGVFWSLTVEIIFYGWIALMIATRTLKHFETFALVMLLFAAVQNFSPLPTVLYIFLLPYWSCYFVAGAFFHLIQTKGLTNSRLAVLALCFILSILQTSHYTAKIATLYADDFSLQTALLITASFYVFFVMIVAIKRSVTIPGAVTLGAMSYPIYLLHENIGYITLNAYSTEQNRYWVLGLFIIAVMAASFLISRKIEKNLGLKIQTATYQALMFLSLKTKAAPPLTTDQAVKESNKALKHVEKTANQQAAEVD